LPNFGKRTKREMGKVVAKALFPTPVPAGRTVEEAVLLSMSPLLSPTTNQYRVNHKQQQKEEEDTGGGCQGVNGRRKNGREGRSGDPRMGKRKPPTKQWSKTGPGKIWEAGPELTAYRVWGQVGVHWSPRLATVWGKIRNSGRPVPTIWGKKEQQGASTY